MDISNCRICSLNILFCRYLYYTDWGQTGSLTRSALDGSDATILLTGMDNPNSVLVSQSGELHVVDSHDKSDSRSGALYTVSINEQGETHKREVPKVPRSGV